MRLKAGVELLLAVIQFMPFYEAWHLLDSHFIPKIIPVETFTPPTLIQCSHIPHICKIATTLYV